MVSAVVGGRRGLILKPKRIGPKTFFPMNLYQIRVMSYVYNSGGIWSKSVSDIEDVARELLVRLQGHRLSGPKKSRPILFIPHSLGGVVVKKVSCSFPITILTAI